MPWLNMLHIALLLVTLVAAVSAVLTCQIAATSQEASVTVMSAAIDMETAVVISMIFNAQIVSVSIMNLLMLHNKTKYYDNNAQQ